MQSIVKENIEIAQQNSHFNITEELKKLRTKGFKKELTEKIKTTYETELPVELLPQGNSKWRFSNTISLLANGKDIEADTRLDLQKQAMEILS